MRVLVTGANGLLGSNLCRELLLAGHEVRALVRRGSTLTGIETLALELVYGDVRDAEVLRQAAEGCAILYHTAAVFAYWGYARDAMMETAKAGSVNAIDAAKAASVRRIVMTSSSAVFGGSDSAKVLDEKAPMVSKGVPDYFVSKGLQEQTAVEHAAKVGVELVCANPSVFIGPYDFRPSASLATVTGYLTDPLKLTYPGGSSIIHATDVARAHILLAERGEPGQRYLVAAENVTWRDVHETISELAGVPGPRLTITRRPALLAAAFMELGSKITGKPPLATKDLAKQTGRYFWYSNAKIARLGFMPRSMRQTLAQTIGWLMTSPHLSAAQKKKLELHPDVEAAMQELTAAEAKVPKRPL